MATARTIACRFLASSAAFTATLALGATQAQAQAVAPQDSSVGAASAQRAGAAGPSERSSQAPVKLAAGCDAATAKLQRTLRDLRYAIGRTDGCDSAATRAAIQAFQKAQGLTADGVAGRLTLRALRSPLRPTARPTVPGSYVEVDLARQLLLIIRDGRVDRIYAATTGMAGHETPAGVFRIVRKETRSWSGEYNVWMPWASYFDGTRGLAIHAGDMQPGPASHGCVRVPAVFARQIFAALPMATPVVIG